MHTTTNNFMQLIPQYLFSSMLSKIQTTTYVKVRTIHMPAVIRRFEMDKLSYLMDQYSKLQANEIAVNFMTEL